MKKYRSFICLISILICQQGLSAQAFERIDPYRHMKENIQFMNDANGRPFKALRGFEEEGSPYFLEDYIESTIQMLSGKIYQKIPIKINQLTGEILFRTEDGLEMSMSRPFQRIEVNNNGQQHIFRSGFPPIDQQTDRSLYQLLDSGAAIFLKYTSVTYQDKQAYNSATTTRVYTKKTIHYAWMSGRGLERIPKKEEDWGDFFAGYKKQIDTFIRTEKLKMKKEEDMIKVFAFYNHLQQQVNAMKK